MHIVFFSIETSKFHLLLNLFHSVYHKISSTTLFNVNALHLALRSIRKGHHLPKTFEDVSPKSDEDVQTKDHLPSDISILSQSKEIIRIMEVISTEFVELAENQSEQDITYKLIKNLNANLQKAF